MFTNVLIKLKKKVTTLLELYPKGIAEFKRITEMLDIDPDVVDKEEAQSVDKLNGDIAFNEVTFGYEKTQRPVLNNLSFNVHAGETIAFVGSSGAGKTTICSLIPRFYDVDKGNITIDGLDLREIGRASCRERWCAT